MKQIINEIWQNRNFKLGLILLLLVIIFSAILPNILPGDPNFQNMEKCYTKPTSQHICGTDNLGRDIFLRLIHGSGLSLKISLTTSLFSVLIGLTIGFISGSSPKSIDYILMRMTDLFFGFPKYFLFILVLGFGEFSLLKLIIVLSIFSWMETAKMVRSETHYINSSLFVKSAICQGLSKSNLFFIHYLPNLAGILISSYTLQVSTIILVESGISFIGLGVQSPNISLGTILNQARYFPYDNYTLIIFSGLFILLNVSTFHFLGDGLKATTNKEKFQK